MSEVETASADDILTEVTAEQFATVREELEALLKTKQKKGEDLPEYAARLAKMAADPKKVSDDDWEGLSETPTQKWVNGANVALEAREQVPLPPGTDDGDEGDDVDEAEEAAAKEAAKAPRTTRGRSAKKQETPAKKAKAAAPKKQKTPAKKAVAGGKPRGRPRLFSDDDIITVKEKEPFRAGTMSAKGFALLKTGMTVKKAVAAGTTRRLIRWANICDYIDVAPAE